MGRCLCAQVAKGVISAEQLLAPPHAVGDPATTLTPAQLANQVGDAAVF